MCYNSPQMNSSAENITAAGAPAPRNSEKAKKMNRATARHIVPFIVWVAVLVIAKAMHLTPSSATETIQSLNIINDASLYALSTVVCTILFLLLKPWRFYEPLRLGNILPAIGVGLFIFAIWVFFETPLFKNLLPAAADLYEKWGVMPFGEMRPELDSTPYAPEVCGWPLTITKLIGSAFVIAVIEEFFWRGWLIRFIRTPDFLDVDVGEFNAVPFFIAAVIFGFEHNEWAAGVATGIVYGFFFIRTRDIWAVSIAHVVTNLALGIYVISTGSWRFW